MSEKDVVPAEADDGVLPQRLWGEYSIPISRRFSCLCLKRSLIGSRDVKWRRQNFSLDGGFFSPTVSGDKSTIRKRN